MEEQTQTPEEQRPHWLYANGEINEERFCKEFLQRNPMCYYGGRFYNIDGMVDDESRILTDLYETIRPHVHRKQTKRAEELLRALRLISRRDIPAPDPLTIHFANGSLHMTKGFREKKTFCYNRLPMELSGAMGSGCPTWERFLHTLLEPEDVETLMQFLGYCLLPTTKAQRMLMIVGQGGEGKSVIGQVMHGIFGSSMMTSSVAKLEHNRFARADLEGKLLMVDDDMDMGALKSTNYLKSIVTAAAPMDVERKGIQSYQVRLYARLLCFGNGALESLYDRSDGFYRRQIILTAKPRDPRREDDPFLVEKLLREKEGILAWMLESLRLLLSRNFQFSLSEQAQRNLQEQRSNGFGDIPEFLRGSQRVCFDPRGKVSSRSLYDAYQSWCADNLYVPIRSRAFFQELNRSCERYELCRSNAIPGRSGKPCRGYVGMCLNDAPTPAEDLPGGW